MVCIRNSGAFCAMTRDEALAILSLPTEEAIASILLLAEKAEKYDKQCATLSCTTPSGMKPVYSKPAGKKRAQKSGRKKGHVGSCRAKPEKIDTYRNHTIQECPDCNNPLGQPIKTYQRFTEEIPEVKPTVTQNTINGYWCKFCKKVVYAPMSDAFAGSTLGLRLVVFTAWLHYFVGMSVSNVVKMLSAFAHFQVSTGGLTQAWKKLAFTLEPFYIEIGKKISQAAVLHGDETGWRINGITHWLWCFATKKLCYYLIEKSRGSLVVKKVFGTFFTGILICDFWGAYNALCALAKQRCFYHLFTELVKVNKSNKSVAWKTFRKKLSRLLKDAVRLSNKKSSLVLNRFESLKTKLYTRLELLLVFDGTDKDVKRLLKRLRRHKNELFTFLEHEGVSPYNNHGEQQMRNPAINRKISHQNRSMDGAKTQAILMSLFKSATLQNTNPIETILAMAKQSIDPKSIPTFSPFDIAA